MICLAGGAAVLFYYFMYPFLQTTFPNNAFYVIAVSTGYFVVLLLFLGYALRPLFIYIMTVSPRRTVLATPNNHEIEAIGTFVYLAVGVWIYFSVVVKKLKA